MVLTEEQKERIRINRERALELQKQKKDPQSKQDCKASHKEEKFNGNARELKRPRSAEKELSGSEEKEDLVDEELEMFEEGAPELVTKQEAMKMYCLPAGTLAVCEVVEKPNPRNGAWSKMKLYQRLEVRRRARARYGGLEGLVAERRNREEKRFKSDMEKTKDIFR